MTRQLILSGLDVLESDNFNRLKNINVGVLCHPASVNQSYQHIVDLLIKHHIQVCALFGPEHGFLGFAQDMDAVLKVPLHPVLKCPIYSLYGDSESSLMPTQDMLNDLDVVVIDLQDIGTRYYTFVWTAVMMMQACAKAGVSVLVLDRPNPLGGVIREGACVAKELTSFVGYYDVPVRHGLTIAEIMRLYAHEQLLNVNLEIILCQGWNRQALLGSLCDYAYVYPSPNMPTYETAWVYPGMCLLEATNISEGRGTTKPFELMGAPYIEAHVLADALNNLHLKGVLFRPTVIKPTFHKFAGKLCGGVQIHLKNPDVYNSFYVGLCVVGAVLNLYPTHFSWRKEPYEFVSDRNAFDLLTGNVQWRMYLHDLKALSHYYESEQALYLNQFKERIEKHLLY